MQLWWLLWPSNCRQLHILDTSRPSFWVSQTPKFSENPKLLKMLRFLLQLLCKDCVFCLCVPPPISASQTQGSLCLPLGPPWVSNCRQLHTLDTSTAQNAALVAALPIQLQTITHFRHLNCSECSSGGCFAHPTAERLNS